MRVRPHTIQQRLFGNIEENHQGNLIIFAGGGKPQGQKVVAWTGIFRNGKIETLWHLVADEKLTADVEGEPARKKPLGVQEAFMTGADIFEKSSDSISSSVTVISGTRPGPASPDRSIQG